MARLPIKTKTLKHLFALTGNRCAYPNCEHELFVEDVFVAQVCHIYPANKKWPRFDPKRTDEENRDFSNLLVLCYKHHKIVDNVDSPYSVSALQEIKKAHETRFKDSPVLLNHKKVENIQKQVETFWADILEVVEKGNIDHGMARPIDAKASIWGLLENIEVLLGKLYGVVQETDEIFRQLDETVLPFLQQENFSPPENCPITMFELGYGFDRINWEMRVIGGGNFHGEANYLLKQLKLRVAEYQSLKSPDDKELYQLVLKFREELENAAKNEVYYD